MNGIFYKIITLALDGYWHERYKLYRRKYKLPSDFRFNGKEILIYGDGELTIGENSYIGHSSQIQINKGYRVRIGKNCRLASGVKIYTGTNVADQDFSQKKLQKKYDNIEIGDNVWIGANVFLTPGVVIGENVVVGANSVVNKDLPPWTICGGVPAKVLKEKTR